MKKGTIIIILVYCSLLSNAQTTQEEAKEKQRKYNNPYAPKTSRTRNVEYKLHGYTDSTQLIYTTGITCKIECLSLHEKGLRNILKNGNVNVAKSKLQSTPKEFTVEHRLSKKSYRTVVIPSKKALLVVSVDQLNGKVECDCNK